VLLQKLNDLLLNLAL